MKNFTWKTFAVIAVILIGASIVYSNYASNKANEGVVIEPHIKGNADAEVVLAEYSDFQCPACGQFYPVVKEVMDMYGDRISFEYKHFPLISIHPFAVPAAKAAEAAGQQGKFFEMHDTLFENQAVWSRAGNPQSYFEQYAEDIGLDVALFKRHIGASVIDERIEDDFKEARELGLTGTPSFFLNGERMQYETFEDFVIAVEQALGILPEGEGENSSNNESEEVIFGL